MGKPKAVLRALLISILAFGCENREPIRVGLLFWPPSEIGYLAQQLGYYGNMPVKLLSYGSPAEQVRAYRHGSLDAVVVSAEFFLELLQHDPRHRAVLVVDRSLGADAVIARRGIASVADLKGRTVGVEASALSTYLLARALQQAGLTLADVRLMPIDIPDQARAFQAGKVDAVVTYEPARSALLKSGGVELFSSADVPGEILDLMVVHQELIERRPEMVAALVGGWQRGTRFLQQNPRRAADIVASEREGLTAAGYLNALEGVRLPEPAENAALLASRDPRLLEGLQRQARLMHDLGILETPLPAQWIVEALTPRFAQEEP